MVPHYGGQQGGSGPCHHGAGDGCLLSAWEMWDWQPWPEAVRALGSSRGSPRRCRAAALVVDITLPFTAAVCTAAQSHRQLESPTPADKGNPASPILSV